MDSRTTLSTARRTASSVFAFIFGLSVLGLAFALWVQASLADTAGLSVAIEDAAESEVLAKPILEATASAVAFESGAPVEPVYTALLDTWDSAEAQLARTAFAGSVVTQMSGDAGSGSIVDLTDAVRPVMRRAADALGDGGLPVAEPQIDLMLADVGPTRVVVDGRQLPLIGTSMAVASAVDRSFAVGIAVAAVSGLAAWLVTETRQSRLTWLCFAVSAGSGFVAALLWIVGYFGSRAVPDEALARATASVFGSNLMPVVVIGVVGFAAGVAVRASDSSESGSDEWEIPQRRLSSAA